MLEHVPHALGQALAGVRAGIEKIVGASEDFAGVPSTLALTSPAFAEGEPLPATFTDDGAKTSPPLAWRHVPSQAKSLVLFIEDPDAPSPEPLVHAIAWDLDPTQGGLAEGALLHPSDAAGAVLGKNSFFKSAYLPPDPPTGHGVHRYVFQLFALDRKLDLPDGSGRRAVVDAMRGHAVAKGMLMGLYERR